MDNDSRLIFEALQSKVFTIVNGGTDNSAEHGFDINPVKHIQASDLKSAVNHMITKMAEDPDVEPEDINQTFPKEFREFREDHFVMSNDNGDWYYVFPGKLTDEQAYDRVLATGDYGSEDEEDSAEDKMRNRENARDEKRRDTEVSAAFHYNPMEGLEKAANQIRDILQGAANDEVRTEHIIKMAQTILGDPTEYDKNEYRKILDGLIVLLNRFIVVPMN